MKERLRLHPTGQALLMLISTLDLMEVRSLRSLSIVSAFRAALAFANRALAEVKLDRLSR